LELIKHTTESAKSKRNSVLRSYFFQPQFTINQPNDIYEQEAAAVAEKVMRMPADETKPAFFQPKPLPVTPVQRKCAECEEEEKLQMKAQTGDNAGMGAPPVVHNLINSAGQPLDAETRSFMESRFEYDFGNVQIHNDSVANKSSVEINALAYTHGNHIVFGEGKYNSGTRSGKKLLAHELADVVQQGNKSQNNNSGNIMLQRDTFHTPRVSVRSPVFEETVTQITELENGRPLNKDEMELARKIFGVSISYSKVRLIPTPLLQYRTVANSIRIPEKFTIKDPEMAQTFIHEMTHVWQYQHSGTSYMSISLQTQIVAGVTRGNRNFAYEYKIKPGQSFFDFTPEQQGFIVENYFSMLRDEHLISSNVVKGYESNHLSEGGFRKKLTAQERLSEITEELPIHETLIQQMRMALPKKDVDLLLIRATDVMQTPGQDLIPVPPERQLVPIKPLLEVRW
jgi:hypothetical protein